MSMDATGSVKRRILRIEGSDARGFLQGLVTNDVNKVDDGPVYAALLSPQGKYMFDFLLFLRDGTIHLDVAGNRAEALVLRLGMYRLRADVRIVMTDLVVERGIEDPPASDDCFRDPRHGKLGWRCYREPAHQKSGVSSQSRLPDPDLLKADVDWTAVRVENGIPESGVELIPNTTYILEAGFDRLNGIDFSKGCYVGQEVTARMRLKTTLRKGLAIVRIDGRAPPGTPILSSGRAAGTLYSQSGGKALAHLRFDRLSDDMTASGARVFAPDALKRGEPGSTT
ncbi:MAG: folate-binding protein [Paracoccaceae bacterium]|nr:folate-binding protein [Paracoccaceae bacterium]MDE2913063.1 folate-binding protein [Paracoccaceae bacterium]